MPDREQQYKMIGLNIAYYRKLKGLSQIKLAEATGLSRTYISNIEAPNMPVALSLDALLNIAEALDVPAKKLLDFRD